MSKYIFAHAPEKREECVPSRRKDKSNQGKEKGGKFGSGGWGGKGIKKVHPFSLLCATSAVRSSNE